MTYKELKSLLKTAYTFEDTWSEKLFLAKYEKRSLQLFDIVKTQFKFMGLKSAIAGALLFIVFLIL